MNPKNNNPEPPVECDEPDACMTELLFDAGRDRDAVRAMTRAVSQFLYRDWPTWKGHINARMDGLSETIEDHIRREDQLPHAIQNLEAKHNKDLAMVQHALWGADPLDDKDDSVVAVSRTIHKCIKRWRRIALWVAGAGGAVVVAVVIEYVNSGAFRSWIHRLTEGG